MSAITVTASSSISDLLILGWNSITSRLLRGEVSVRDAAQDDLGWITERGFLSVTECRLDCLFADGCLGGADGGDEARRRHEAGIWLRRLYIEETGFARSLVMSNTIAGGEMSDDRSEAISLFQGTMRKVSPYARVLADVCCHDDVGHPLAVIRLALTKLADVRGM